MKRDYIMASVLLATSALIWTQTFAAGVVDREGYLDRKGDRIDRCLDRKGDRIDARLDRRGNRVDARVDRPGVRSGPSAILMWLIRGRHCGEYFISHVFVQEKAGNPCRGGGISRP